MCGPLRERQMVLELKLKNKHVLLLSWNRSTLGASWLCLMLRYRQVTKPKIFFCWAPQQLIYHCLAVCSAAPH